MNQNNYHRPTNATNTAEVYDFIDAYIVELYDREEEQRDDLVLIQELVGETPAHILEPFCGHGRLLLPLAEAGHKMVGLDHSQQLLMSLECRLRELPAAVQECVTFRRCDVIAEAWPSGFDVVLLGGNCLYELATPEEQEHCIRSAAAALKPGGHLFLDNNHMEGALSPTWYEPRMREHAFPTGICADGTRIQGTLETLWYDAGRRLIRFRRTATIRTPEGETYTREVIQQKHPPSTEEMADWLKAHGFVVEALWGDRRRAPYRPTSPQAIFWARKA